MKLYRYYDQAAAWVHSLSSLQKMAFIVGPVLLLCLICLFLIWATDHD